MPRDDLKALTKLETETNFAEGRYTVPMLRKPSPALPDSSGMALNSFRFLLKRLRGDAQLYEKYKAIVDGYLTSGYARRMSPAEAQVSTLKSWYLPHRPVVNAWQSKGSVRRCRRNKQSQPQQNSDYRTPTFLTAYVVF